jgi:hypothetical protein
LFHHLERMNENISFKILPVLAYIKVGDENSDQIKDGRTYFDLILESEQSSKTNLCSL